MIIEFYCDWCFLFILQSASACVVAALSVENHVIDRVLLPALELCHEDRFVSAYCYMCVCVCVCMSVYPCILWIDQTHHCCA